MINIYTQKDVFFKQIIKKPSAEKADGKGVLLNKSKMKNKKVVVGMNI